MSSPSARTEFIRNASQLVQRGVQFENQKNYPVAIYFYTEAIYLLQRASDEKPDNDDGEDAQHKFDNDTIEKRISQYRDRISALQQAVDDLQSKEQAEQAKEKKPEELLLEKAYFLLNQALTADENWSGSTDDRQDAFGLYTDAVEACLKAKAQPNIPPETCKKINQIATQALERAESLKASLNPERPVSTSSPKPPQRPIVSQAPAAAGYAPNIGDTSTGSASGSTYTEEEKRVLLKTSRINGIDYLPFMPIDLKEQFTFILPFEDRNGLLKLSPKQRKVFCKWVRPDEVFSTPKMIERIDSFTIKQTIISDCSFVASLAISANYERRFGKKLIRCIIYPQNHSTGEPIVNPYGKYMVKLLLNGVPRKIIIDDFLPVGTHGEFLCSYTSNKGELWVSLLEKAYMKVMGGYDFPGSNSNIDLHALTGWIPERLSISSDKERDKTFRMLMSKMGAGHLLATVATGEISEREADRAGLVPTHAYAVLDVRIVNGVKLFLLKNPWSHLRWKGNYSELDTVHWTADMKAQLNYDPNNAAMFDNGVFWIDYDSIIKFFDVFYMNWNPDLFPFTYCTHKSWDSGLGPAKDVYTIGDNPQYSIEINCINRNGAAVWVLLTRHITDIIDFKDNREYITVLVYDNDGKRVYYPYDPAPIIDGVRINSPHYLCKIVVPPAISTKRYTLVASQYEKTTTIHYTLRVYSTCNFKMGEIINACKYRKREVGEWKGFTAGGCANHPTSVNNPCYRCELKQEGKLIIDLKASKEFQIGFDVICTNTTAQVGPSASGAGAGFYKKSTGAYRPGFVIMELPNVPAGVYNIVPSTFLPGCEGAFFLNIQSTAPFDMKKI